MKYVERVFTGFGIAALLAAAWLFFISGNLAWRWVGIAAQRSDRRRNPRDGDRAYLFR